MNKVENMTLTKDLLDKLRAIEGFPDANGEDIIALSDPPYYTASPNPFIKDFLAKHGKPWNPEKNDYHREPFAADVSEGKRDPIYLVHTYPTKVPYKAVMRYILHYTEPGDIIFDGFAGTGMVGVAAQKCGNPEPEFKEIINTEMPDVHWGERNALLCELSPLATFISYNLNSSIDIKVFEREALRILEEVKNEFGWMYETTHIADGKIQYTTNIKGEKRPVIGTIRYTVWSDIFFCPACSREFVFYDVAVDKDNVVRKEFHCPHCNALLTRRNLERAYETIIDEALGQSIKRAKQVPVLINYEVKEQGKKRGKRYDKTLDEEDLNLIKKIEKTKIPYWYPINKIPDGDKTGEPRRIGITHVHQFYTKRNLWLLATIYAKINRLFDKERKMLLKLKFLFTSQLINMSKLNRYRPNVSFPYNPLNGTLYISSQVSEANVFTAYENKIKRIIKAADPMNENAIISTQSNSSLKNILENSIDYIFTDPPFGGNLMYSELNFLCEAWLKVFTNNKNEAVINKTQGKGLPEYQNLMEKCFQENHRILKPDHWMTVEFHNSQNRVWIAIQEALSRVGFVVADVRILDKKQGTFNQVSTSSQSVKQDLIISAYKPNEGLEQNFKLKGGTEDGVWAFVRYHLKKIPVFVEKDGNVEIVTERQNFLLFDRMVAFHIQRGISVPISASEFYTGLKQLFPIRDDMYFTVDQVHEYDRNRMKVKRVEQVSLFVHDERSAIQWLRRELSREPQTYQDIQPKFLQELFQAKHEDLPELSEILKQNFLQDNEGIWYIPDNRIEADLEKLREKALLREFLEYKDAKGRLRLFRSEAVRTGFSKCWQEGDYGTIVEVAERLPTRVLQEEPILLMYYDNAVMRTQN